MRNGNVKRAKTKILFVVENSRFGGDELAVAQIAAGLPRGEFAPAVACLPGSDMEGQLREAGVPVVPVDFSGLFSIAAYRKLSKIFTAERPSIVHCQGASADYCARIAAHRCGIPAVVSTVAVPVERSRGGFVKKLIYRIADRATNGYVRKFVTVSTPLENILERGHGISAEKISVISNGIDLEKFNPGKHERAKCREKLGIRNAGPVIGTVGRLTAEKGHKFLIEAAAKVIGNGPATFVIAGEGKLRANLEARARSLDISANCIFTGFAENVPEIMGAIDVFVLPSLYAGRSITLLEAMAMGKPIVVTAIEGIDEVVQNELTAAVVLPGSAETLANAIMCLLKNKGRAVEMGMRARKEVKTRFDLKKMVAAHTELYRNLLDPSRPQEAGEDKEDEEEEDEDDDYAISGMSKYEGTFTDSPEYNPSKSSRGRGRGRRVARKY